MRLRIMLAGLLALTGAFGLEAPLLAQEAASASCTSPNGNRFNLEPRPDAVNQTARSLAFLLNGAGPSTDLVVGTAVDARGLQGTLESEDGFYIQRSNSNCAADSEGGLPAIATSFETFSPFGAPVLAADPVHNTFFAADLRLGQQDDTAVGVLRTTAANLLSATTCPSGTQTNSATCWPTGNVVNDVALNFIISDPQVAVDSRTTGTGAGDVYLVGTVEDANNFPPTRTIFLAACTNAQLSCSSSAVPSGSDNVADFPWVQVRPDGGITVTYVNTKAFSSAGFFPFDVKFVTCTPQGAPKAPTCGAPVLVTTESNAMEGTAPGDLLLTNGTRPFLPGDRTFPKHANRLEADGKTVTTFIVYDRCEVPTIGSTLIGSDFCPKTDVVITSSSDGVNWSPVTKVTSSPGQQFFGTVATDTSTETVNIAYYSTQSDPLQEHMQVFLGQIAPGSTAVGTPQLLTSGFSDPQSQSPIVVSSDETYGDHLGLAAAGTGAPGQSHAYVAFTSNNVQGTYVGTSNPDINNHLTRFDY